MNTSTKATQTEATALLPCPFCGSTDIGGASGIISCYGCHAETKQFDFTAQATVAWNRRVHPSRAESKEHKTNLNFDNNGRVSVDVNSLTRSPKVQAQVEAVKKLHEASKEQPNAAQDRNGGGNTPACEADQSVSGLGAAPAQSGSKHKFSAAETDRHLLVTYTPTRYTGNYPEYFNLTMLRNDGSVILTVRLPTVFGAPEGETSSVRFDARTWREFVRLFPEAIKMYDAVDFLDGQM